MENIEALTKQLLALPIDERTRIAEKLLQSLYELSKEENEKLWIAEAKRRIKAFEAGEMASRPASEVHDSILQRLS